MTYPPSVSPPCNTSKAQFLFDLQEYLAQVANTHDHQTVKWRQEGAGVKMARVSGLHFELKLPAKCGLSHPISTLEVY